ncbi:MAG: o-succinylbenzoate synthase [Chloroflexi bacterium]|nr:o-succinylbenzoate synthase [Chloroflexota bacterium]
MKIDRIELRHLKMGLIAPFETSFGIEKDEEHIIVRVDAGGVTGWGECPVNPGPFYSYETTQTAWHVLRDFVVPWVLHQELADAESAMALCSRVRGHNMAKAGLEFALWDAFAKGRGVSLSKMLGGTREQIAVGVSVGIQPSPDVLVERVRGFLRQGYGRIKIKIAPGRDIQYVEAVRRSFPDVMLQVDANSAYTLKDIDRLRWLDDYNLLLIEQPLGNDDIFDHSKLQRELKTPICLDESIHSLEDAKAALELHSCRVINIKPARVGGYGESKRIHDLCASQGVPVWHGGMLESGIGRAGNVALASLPNFTLPGDISASKRYYHQDIVEPEFTVDGKGMMAVPAGAGIGVEVLVDRLERVTEARAEFR